MRTPIHSALLSLMLAVFGMTVQAAVVGKNVEYSVDGTVMKGYIAYDDAKPGKRPGVLVVHEWWGHNPYARKRADMLAVLGYTALALDMYGEGKMASHPKDAGRFSAEVKKNMPLAEARFKAAMDVLHAHPTVDKTKTAAIGYCFGGGIVLEMARRGLDLDGVASFHGSLGTQTPARKGAVKAKVLVMNGEADPFVKPEAIAAFKQEMSDTGVDYTFINYAGAKHSFTNPDADTFGQQFQLPLAYNADADHKSWTRMQAFFNDIFK